MVKDGNASYLRKPSDKEDLYRIYTRRCFIPTKIVGEISIGSVILSIQGIKKNFLLHPTMLFEKIRF